MITDATELDIAPCPQSLPDLRAIKYSSLAIGAISRAPQLGQRLWDRIKRQFDAAVVQNLVFCSGYTIEEIDGECFKVDLQYSSQSHCICTQSRGTFSGYR